MVNFFVKMGITLLPIKAPSCKVVFIMAQLLNSVSDMMKGVVAGLRIQLPTGMQTLEAELKIDIEFEKYKKLNFYKPNGLRDLKMEIQLFLLHFFSFFYHIL